MNWFYSSLLILQPASGGGITGTASGTISFTGSSAGTVSGAPSGETLTAGSMPYGVGWGNAAASSPIFGGVSWQPSDTTATLVGWWDATDAATITESAGLVSQWDDKSGNARHWTATTTQRPTTGTTTIDGKNALDFDGSGNLMQMSSAPTSASSDSMFFAVADYDNIGVNVQNWLLLMGEVAGGDFERVFYYNYVVSTLNASSYGHSASGQSSARVNAKATQIYSGYRNGTSNAVGHADNYDTSANASGAATLASAILGAKNTSATGAFDGQIGEVVLCFSYDLTERQKIEGYLAHKWGLAADLDSGHPYEAAAWGSMTGLNGSSQLAVDGELVVAITWDSGNSQMVAFVDGAGKEAWFSGRKIDIDGTEYTFGTAVSYGGYTYAPFHSTNLFTASGTYTIDFPAAASGVTGTASGSIALTGASAGAVDIAAAAAGSISLAGAAAGAVAVTADAAGALPLTGAATGSAISGIAGEASGTLPLGGAAAGAVIVDAIASGALPIGGGASGAVAVVAVASGSLPLSGAATGVIGSAPVTGVADGSISLGGAATGAVAVSSDATGTLDLIGVAAGAVAVTAVASGDLPLTGLASAGTLVSGAAVGSLALAGAASGAVADALPVLPEITDTGTWPDPAASAVWTDVVAAGVWPDLAPSVAWPDKAASATWLDKSAAAVWLDIAASGVWPDTETTEPWRDAA